MTNNQKANNISEENLRFLLNNKFNDIRHSKQQQWHIMYLTLVAIGSIVSLSISDICKDKAFNKFLLLSIYVIAFYGFLFLRHYGQMIETYRKEKETWLRELTGVKDVAVKKDKDDVKRFMTSFLGLIIGAVVIATWLIIGKAI